MPRPPTKPANTSISKVREEIAVGADLEFQRRWWKFERAVWIVFTAILVLDLLGVFGKGLVAKGQLRSANSAVRVSYDRIARYNTPSTLTVEFTPAAIREGKVQLWVSDEIVKVFGNQRVIPQPLSSELNNHGILYTFGSAPTPDTVEFSLEPKKPGIYRFALWVSGSEELSARVLVMP